MYEEADVSEEVPKEPIEPEEKTKESSEVEIIVFDPNFKYEIAKHPGGKYILRCFQCGTCSGICPVFAIDARYDPQKIIKMALLGLRDEVLSSELIWLCSTCYACYEHCPQDVKITDLMCAIQNIATKNGYPPAALEDKIKLLKEHARTLPMDKFDNKKRAKFNLPEVEEKSEETAKIIENCGIEQLAADAATKAPKGEPAETTAEEKPKQPKEEQKQQEGEQ